MRQMGSAAYRIQAPYVEESFEADRFVAIEGGRLDSEARGGVRPAFSRVIACVVAVALASFALGGVAVALTSGTVAMLQDNNAVSSQIKEERALNGDLRIECSLLSRSERITQIATQNLGMVYASTADSIDLS